MGQRILFLLASTLGKWVVSLYFLTIRITYDKSILSRFNRNRSPSGVYAFWHSHQLIALWHLRGCGAGILISASKDGEYVARIARAFGYKPIRGSSSRGGVGGLKGLIELANTGCPISVTPDGPRGPRHSINPGVLAVARATGQPIVPFVFGLSDFWELRSWDRFRIPKPFSRGVMLMGNATSVPADADDDTLKAIGAKLREEMMALEEKADSLAREDHCRGVRPDAPT